MVYAVGLRAYAVGLRVYAVGLRTYAVDLILIPLAYRDCGIVLIIILQSHPSIPFTNLLCYDDAVDAFQQRQSQNYVDDTEMLEIKLLYQHTESDPR